MSIRGGRHGHKERTAKTRNLRSSTRMVGLHREQTKRERQDIRRALAEKVTAPPDR